MGRLSTHVLDTAQGRPAPGVTIALYRIGDGDARTEVLTTATNADGRTDQPLLLGESYRPGLYELHFHIGAYFRRAGIAGGFLDVVPVRFAMTEADGHYHVPLVCSPWAYSTYRGS